MAVTINGKTYRNQQEQIYKNMDDIQELKDIIKPEYTTSATLTSSSTSVAIASTNAPAGTIEGWLMTQDGLKFKITGGDDTNLLLMFYADLKGPQGEEGPEGPSVDPTVLIDDGSVAENKTWSSDKISTELAAAGKTYYQHNIIITDTSCRLTLKIINDSNTPFTMTSLADWIAAKGFTTGLKLYEATGWSLVDGNVYILVGLNNQGTFYASGINLTNKTGINYGLSSRTLEDIITTL